MNAYRMGAGLARLGLLAAAALATGCAMHAETPAPPEALTAPVWRVTSINEGPLARSDAPTLRFGADGRLSGLASCNRFLAPYTLAGGALALGEIATTKMGCMVQPDAQEQRFLAALAASERYEIQPDGALLLFADGTGPKLRARPSE